MKARLLFILLCITITVTVSAQSVRLINFDTLENRIKSPSDTTYVIHFWATWCKPCVEEMPVFSQIGSSIKNSRLQIVLVSLDFIKDIESVKDFIKKNAINEDVFVLDAPDQNSWIDKISKQWTGSIPATLFFNNTLSKEKLIEKTLTLEQLKSEINSFKSKIK